MIKETKYTPADQPQETRKLTHHPSEYAYAADWVYMGTDTDTGAHSAINGRTGMIVIYLPASDTLTFRHADGQYTYWYGKSRGSVDLVEAFAALAGMTAVWIERTKFEARDINYAT